MAPLTNAEKAVWHKRLRRDLWDTRSRSSALEELCRVAREARAEGDPGWRDLPIMALRLAEELNLPQDAVLRSLAVHFPEDAVWARPFVERLLSQSAPLMPEDVAVLDAIARARESDVSLWEQVIVAARQYLAPEEALPFLRSAALSLSAFFPPRNGRSWPEPDTRDRAQALFAAALDQALANLSGNPEQDAPVLGVAVAHYPLRRDLVLRYAELQRDANPASQEAFDAALKALEVEPRREDLLRFIAARYAAEGRTEEAQEALWRLHDLAPEDQEELAAYLVKGIKEKGVERLREAALLARWCRDHRHDGTACDVLAQFHAKRRDLSPQAVSAYRTAPSTSHHRTLYLRLIGEAHASRGQWQSVVDTLEDVLERGELSDESVLTLAEAYGALGTAEGRAIEVYRRAVKLGSTSEPVHSNLCRHLLRNDPVSAESQALFRETLQRVPGCSWARLGLAHGALKSGAFEEALDAALALLQDQPGDLEARQLAGTAVAGRPQPALLKKAQSLDSATYRAILEIAHERQPDALPLVEALARERYRAGVRDGVTARLLGKVCRRDPNALDLRVAWADVLYDIGQGQSGFEIDRSVVEAWRSDQNPGERLPAEDRLRVLTRVARKLSDNADLSDADRDILLEAALDPHADDELLRCAGQVLLKALPHEHALRPALLVRLRAALPEMDSLDIELAQNKAEAGDGRPALRLALAQLARGRGPEVARDLLQRALPSLTAANAGAENRRAALDLGRDGTALDDESAVLLARVVALFQDSLAQEHLPLLERAVRLSPDDPTIVGALATIYEASGDTARAALSLRRVLALSPQDQRAAVRLAKLHSRIGRADESGLDVAQQAFFAHPDDPDLAFHYASVALETGHMEEACEALRVVFGLAPEKSGDILDLMEQHSNRVFAHGDSLLLLAQVSTAAGHYTQALEALRRLRPVPEDLAPLLDKLYNKLVVVSPDNPTVRQERARYWLAIGRATEAAGEFEEALRLGASEGLLLPDLARSYEEWLRRETSPSPGALLRLARLRLLQGEEESALLAVDRLLAVMPSHPEGLSLRARLLLAQKRSDEALLVINRLPDGSEKEELLQALAARFEEEGRYGEASDALTSLLSFLTGPSADLIRRLRDMYQDKDTRQKHDTDHPSADIKGALSDREQKRYQVRKLLGRGAMGEVYLAHDLELDELIVLKLLPESAASDPQAQSRLRHEAKAARRLSHPNIVRIHDIGYEGNRPHISMEYVPGGDLLGYLAKRRQRLKESTVVDVIRQVARALAHAHEVGVLHLDIKPGNILLAGQGKVKLSDFGIASVFKQSTISAIDPRESRATPAARFGTPMYMSPEQFEVGDPTAASDIYSLGILFYELLAGQPPFDQGSIAYHHQFTKPKPLPDTVNPLLVRVVMKCLEKEPQHRFHSAEELLVALDDYESLNPAVGRQSNLSP